MYSLFLIDGLYCVAKEINKAWVVRFKTKSKFEAELFEKRLNLKYNSPQLAMARAQAEAMRGRGLDGFRAQNATGNGYRGLSGLVGSVY